VSKHPIFLLLPLREVRLFATTLLSEPVWCCYAKAMPMGYSQCYGLSHYKIRSFYDATAFTVAMF